MSVRSFLAWHSFCWSMNLFSQKAILLFINVAICLDLTQAYLSCIGFTEIIIAVLSDSIASFCVASCF